MPAKTTKPTKKDVRKTASKPAKSVESLDRQLQSTLAALKRLGTKRIREEMGPRYGITGPSAQTAFGVSMSNLKLLAKGIHKQGGPNHELALALWETGNYEARLLTSLIDDPALVTSAQMDRWCKDFDNWGVCDTLCFNLFDRTPHAFDKIVKWAKWKNEYQKRAAFALLACVALHNKAIPDEDFLRFLPLVESAATDERNFVKKGVLWALRGIGSHTPKRKAAALKLAQKLSDSTDTTARWIGKTALREISK